MNALWALPVLQLGAIGAVVYGSIRTADLAWAMGDLGVGLMAWLNITVILFLQKPALAALRDYEAQRRAGLDPVYNAEVAGVTNAPLWDEIRRRYRAEAAAQQE